MIRDSIRNLFGSMNYKHWAEQLRERIDQLDMERWDREVELAEANRELVEVTAERNEEVRQLQVKVFDLERENERLGVHVEELYQENATLKTLVREHLG